MDMQQGDRLMLPSLRRETLAPVVQTRAMTIRDVIADATSIEDMRSIWRFQALRHQCSLPVTFSAGDEIRFASDRGFLI
jgi:hypothetical protein